jgi:hypothetical protein
VALADSVFVGICYRCAAELAYFDERMMASRKCLINMAPASPAAERIGLEINRGSHAA